MITNELTNKIIRGEDPAFDEADRAAIEWQYHLSTMGGFRRALWGAIEAADQNNLERLNKGFPIETTGFWRWTRGDLAKRLQAAGEEVQDGNDSE